jgi:4-amino-4-deoxy-L-arabinose transferase-like glycosyltransferase
MSPPPERPFWKRPAFLYAVVICLLVRLAHLVLFGDKITVYSYEHSFAIQAMGLLEGRGLVANDVYFKAIEETQFPVRPRLLNPDEYPPNHYHADDYYHATDMPGYAWILAGIWWISGDYSFWLVKTIQALLSFLLIFPLCGISKRLFGDRTALITAWLYSFWLPSAYLAQMVSKESWEILFLVLCVHTSLVYLEQGSRRYLVLGALAFVSAVFLRSNLALITICMAGAGVLLFPWRRCLALVTVHILLMAMALIPWVQRNRAVVDPSIGVKEGFYWGIIGGMAGEDPEIQTKLTELEGRKVLPDGRPARFQREPPEVPDWTRELLRERWAWYAEMVIKRLIETPIYKLDWGYEMLPEEARSVQMFKQKTGGGNMDYFRKYWMAAAFKAACRAFEVSIGLLAILALWIQRRNWGAVLWLAVCYWGMVSVYALIHLEFRYLAPHTWALLVLAASALAMPYLGCNNSRSVKSNELL